ncbi:coiled-coil domain-containing protein [Aliarcobacter skirrowii]|uniref:hypothetical protein n=1 Tax=Aliarcobacter skirrowii TaxID=28200 RepID=UPI000D61C842|nr:hypothetical protein [Aliarcobacter skirrowii]MDX4012000.1 hypothetical protein [Aliarcobacter skirrowii]MDX4026034.1 hypothetical protein [Aliarcobacter skirrowii]MDX4048550.1 hypothetical protein [Aliarcobacter skirrowii]MDX4057787.1 hypothetical protein [Aliarcobacter skirrowii]MDX4063745.1 hypothetical protein [Aliarcobacter skirrowii]
MTNTETISKLNSALNRLMDAYQELQKENEELKVNLEAANSELVSVKDENSSLLLKVNELKSNTEDDKETISTMLGQIENILSRGSKTFSDTKIANIENIEDDKEIVSQVEEFLEDKLDESNHNSNSSENNNLLSFTPEQKEEPKKDSNKLDLNDERLSSLLGIMQ